jgi:hypothetical protein
LGVREVQGQLPACTAWIEGRCGASGRHFRGPSRCRFHLIDVRIAPIRSDGRSGIPGFETS